MENQNETTIRNDNNQSNNKPTNNESNTPNANNQQSTNTPNTREINKPATTPSSDTQEYTPTIQEIQEEYATYDPRGSTLYNETIQKLDPNSPDVQPGEFHTFRDREHDTFGYF